MVKAKLRKLAQKVQKSKKEHDRILLKKQKVELKLKEDEEARKAALKRPICPYTSNDTILLIGEGIILSTMRTPN
jgi:hypothetical protein